MIKKLIEENIKNIFKELDELSKEMAQIEYDKQNSTNLTSIVNEKGSKEMQLKMMQFHIKLTLLQGALK